MSFSGESVLVTASSLTEKKTGREIAEKKRVRTESIDALIERGKPPALSLLKVDAEGAEHLVFRGAAEALKREKPDVICEFLSGAPNLDEIDARFKELGYRFLRIDDAAMTLSPVDGLSGATGMHNLNTLITTKPDELIATRLREMEAHAQQSGS